MSAQGWGHFWPQGYNLNNLGRGLLGEAMYQISMVRDFWFQIRRFLKVFSICLSKTCRPWVGPFLVSDKIFLRFSLYKSM